MPDNSSVEKNKSEESVAPAIQQSIDQVDTDQTMVLRIDLDDDLFKDSPTND
ncbi:MAG: hypothetical protein HQL69_24410 [Magnetococcales bacterium]|nr:hypothetical protein [Magnetococcales bacterium]